MDIMDSLFDLLSNRIPDEPPEIRVIKDYVRRHFQQPASVVVREREREIIITVRSSALAGTLRARSADINKVLLGNALGNSKPDAPAKRLVFRIGQVEV